jgi:hypothetical protein
VTDRIYIGRTADTLADGQPLGFGDEVSLDADAEKANQHLIDAGLLVEAQGQGPEGGHQVTLPGTTVTDRRRAAPTRHADEHRHPLHRRADRARPRRPDRRLLARRRRREVRQPRHLRPHLRRADGFFGERGSVAYVSRVVGPAATVATHTFNDALSAPSIRVDAANPGDWGARLTADRRRQPGRLLRARHVPRRRRGRPVPRPPRRPGRRRLGRPATGSASPRSAPPTRPSSPRPP